MKHISGQYKLYGNNNDNDSDNDLDSIYNNKTDDDDGVNNDVNICF